MQSWQAARDQVYQIGPNPVYFSLTTLLFYLLGSSNELARFWPALAGSLVVLGPLGFKRWLGQGPALLMALGLAFDPGMVAVSRLAGGPMMAIGLSLLTVAFLLVWRPVWAGLFAGLTLVSGPGFLIGLVGLLIAYAISRVSGLLPALKRLTNMQSQANRIAWSRQETRTFGWVAGSTAVLIATLFFLFPGGLGAWGNMFAAYWMGWFIPGGIPLARPVAAVVAYQPLALVFGLVGAVRGWLRGDKVVRGLSLWFLAALLVVVIYPGRQVYDAAWSLVPLWGLAAIELWRYFQKPSQPLVAYSQASIVLVLLALFWIISLNIVPGAMSWVVLVALPLLVLTTTILMGMGWSWEASLQGLAWGASLCLGLYSLAAMVGVSHIQPNHPAELWQPLPGVGQVELLKDSLQELALTQNGRTDWIDIVSSLDSPALVWLLRDFAAVEPVSLVGPEVLASVIITPAESGEEAVAIEQPSLSQAMAYRGQDFTWASYPGWQGALPTAWWQWITTREAPIQTGKIILWARSDLFPEEPQNNQFESPLSPGENLNGEQPSEPVE
jgi:hypothetical protein